MLSERTPSYLLLPLLILLIGLHRIDSLPPAAPAHAAFKKCTLVLNVTEADGELVRDLYPRLRDCPQFSGGLLPPRSQVRSSSSVHQFITFKSVLYCVYSTCKSLQSVLSLLRVRVPL